MPQMNHTTAIRVGERLPDLKLPRADGVARPLRGAHREAVVVVALHDADCDECRRYLMELAEARPRFQLWDGSVRAVTDAPDVAGLQASIEEAIDGTARGGGDSAGGSGVDVLVDADRALLDRVGTDVGPVVLVADRYGQLFEILPGGPDHALASPRELEEWLQYLATQCPE